MIYTSTIDTPLGPATVSSEDGALTGFWFVGQKYYPQHTADWIVDSSYPVFADLRGWITDYFAGKEPQLTFPLAPKGSPFQKAVWDILLHIPYGELTTYGTIAKQLAQQQGLSSMSAQAVGGAVGHNPVSLVIPCHRVVGSNGSLTGYAGGIDKKTALLELEQVNLFNWQHPVT
ncbi:methylated-DNA--[protein]-cysteine S-methyltransferase [Paenibacillus sp. sgz500958]|uniref:methylated-DNA--[protein]-cysteine S-methyltransferase n=1 Tax=Paenibacillus sp. sgz500958 TaxID=3242475 RepID=UPI0036D40074